MTDTALNAVTRDAGAKWFIPTENEWYKAAYHKNDGPTNHYWSYPTRSNSLPNSDQPPGDPSIQTNVGNFVRFDGTNYNTGLAVTGMCCSFNNENLLTNVGAYAFSPSPYGTFDQGGNVLEWNEAIIDGTFRGLRGGSWGLLSNYLNFSYRDVFYNPAYEGNSIGFRVATVPTIPPIAGDYNGDGVVDDADYAMWRNEFGMVKIGMPADGSGDGTVDQADYVMWRDHFGEIAGKGASLHFTDSLAAAVPEPRPESCY